MRLDNILRVLSARGFQLRDGPAAFFLTLDRARAARAASSAGVGKGRPRGRCE